MFVVPIVSIVSTMVLWMSVGVVAVLIGLRVGVRSIVIVAIAVKLIRFHVAMGTSVIATIWIVVSVLEIV